MKIARTLIPPIAPITDKHDQGQKVEALLTKKPPLVLKFRKQLQENSPAGLDQKGHIIDQEEENSEDGDPKPPPVKGPPKHTRTSLLRPKSNKVSKKFTSRRENLRSVAKGKTTIPIKLEEVSGSDTESDKDITRDRSDTKDAVNHPNAMNGEVKRSKTTPKASTKTNENTTRSPLPSYYEPHGPGDTWTCPYNGCNHKVWDARALDSLNMIQDHFTDAHAGNVEELINMESRPWVSVK